MTDYSKLTGDAKAGAGRIIDEIPKEDLETLGNEDTPISVIKAIARKASSKAKSLRKPSPLVKFFSEEWRRTAAISVIVAGTSILGPKLLSGDGNQEIEKKSPDQARIVELENQLKEQEATLTKKFKGQIEALRNRPPVIGTFDPEKTIYGEYNPDRDMDIISFPAHYLTEQPNIAIPGHEAVSFDKALKIIGRKAADEPLSKQFPIAGNPAWDTNMIVHVDETFLQSAGNREAFKKLIAIMETDIEARGESSDGFYYIVADEKGNPKIVRDPGQQGGDDLSFIYPAPAPTGND